jgi:hypothetical protein
VGDDPETHRHRRSGRVSRQMLDGIHALDDSQGGWQAAKGRVNGA